MRASARIGGWCHSQRTPSAISWRTWRRSTVAWSGGGVAAMRPTRTAAARAQMASTPNGTAIPIPNRSAPSGGPARSLARMRDPLSRELATPRCSLGTAVASRALPVLSANISAVPRTNRRAQDDGDRHGVGRDRRCEDGQDDGPRRVDDDRQAAPVDPVDEGAGGDAEDDPRQELHERREGDGERFAGDRRDQQRPGRDEQTVADVRDGRRAPQPAEVASQGARRQPVRDGDRHAPSRCRSGVAAQAGGRCSSNAAKPSRASALTRCRAMTRAVCHLDDAVPEAADLADDRLGRARRGRVRPPARRRPPTSTAASSAASPSTTSWTSPMRWARTASNRRPPGNRARAWVSPILAMTNGAMTAGRMPRRVSVKPNRVPLSAMTTSLTAHRPMPPPSAAPWTRAMTGTGQRVERLEHVGHRHRVLLVALDVEGHRRAHPGDVGTGTERRAVTGQDDGPEVRRRPRGRVSRTSCAARRWSRHRRRCGRPVGRA